MSTLSCMAEAAAAFRARLLAIPDIFHHPVPCEDHGSSNITWTNLLVSSPSFRHAHVETFDVPGRVSVLHVCIFPHLDDPGPIFGFDMIAGATKVTGIFLDLSGTLSGVPTPRLRDLVDSDALGGFSLRRSLPEWGTIFSPDVLAIRPVDLTEIQRGLQLGHQALEGLLSYPRARSEAFSAAVHTGQQHYIDAQRQNEHTFRMLASFVGNERARRFIDETLFPSPSMISTRPGLDADPAAGDGEMHSQQHCLAGQR